MFRRRRETLNQLKTTPTQKRFSLIKQDSFSFSEAWALFLAAP